MLGKSFWLPMATLWQRELVRFWREKARVLGTRALQISMGAPVLVNPDENLSDPLEIAGLELKARKIPIVIRRYLPDGSWEDWAVDELIVD